MRMKGNINTAEDTKRRALREKSVTEFDQLISQMTRTSVSNMRTAKQDVKCLVAINEFRGSKDYTSAERRENEGRTTPWKIVECVNRSAQLFLARRIN